MAIAKWWKIDFHTHTPASTCFKNKLVTAEEWINSAIDSGLDGVVVTDHNSVEWIKRLREENLKINKKDKKRNLVIFPGVELCVGTSFIHVLIVFNPALSNEKIQEFLTRTGITSEYYADTTMQVSEDELSKLIKEYYNDILVIPAHFNKNKGLCKELNQNGIREFAKKIRIDAIEVRDEDDEREYNNKVKNKIISPVALVVGSDNPGKAIGEHSIIGFGDSYTCIKMSECSIEGMRQAFLDPETRITCVLKNGKINSDNLNEVSQNYIAGMQIRKLKHVDNLNFRLSPSLNCIIGGRGSGKSTIVEMIRLALNKYEEGVDKNTLIENTFIKDSEAQVFYNFGTKNNFGVKVIAGERNGNKWQYEDSKGIITEYPDFPISIYSQKEIYNLVEDDNNPEKLDYSPLLKIIDENIVSEKISIEEEARKYKKNISDLTQELEIIKNDIKDIPKINAEIQLGLGKLEKFNSTGIIEKRDKLREVKEEYETIKINLENYKADIGEVIKHINDGAEGCKKKISQNTGEVNESYIMRLEIIKNEMNSVLSLGSKNLDSLIKELNESELARQLKEAKDLYDESVKELEGIDIDNYKQIEDNINVQREKLTILEEKSVRKCIIIKDIEEKVNDYLNSKNKLFEERECVIKQINCTTSNIKIEIDAFSHGERWLYKLRKELGKANAFNDNFDSLYKFIFSNNKVNMVNFKRWIRFILLTNSGDIREVLGDEVKLDSRFESLWKDKYKTGSLSTLISIIPEDRVRIKIVNNNVETSINEGSPGQKSAAILAFILSQGTAPLIIDQPEDDLDNSLIIDLIVENIRKIKANRQVIIVTHNPNIPVLGDAEGIIMLDRNADGKVSFKNGKATGCIEEKTIKNGICDIMEGGIEAFKKRESKYKV
ncbi:MAG: TrlF family AAA-like ATPase [Sarcina sp.]